MSYVQNMQTRSVSWQEYLGAEPESSPGDLAMFPLVDETTKMTPQLLSMKMLVDRFRWLRTTYASTDPADLFTVWSDPEFFITEMGASKHRVDFYKSSHSFAIHLLQDEPNTLYYLRLLRDCLNLRVQPGESVLFVGPTSGAELEAISDAGGDPILVGDPSSEWAVMCEERMLDNRLPFENMAPRDIVRNPIGARHLVLSKWLDDATLQIKTAYRALGLCGFVFHPATNLAMAAAAKSANLRPLDTHQNAVNVWLKHIGLPEELPEVFEGD